MGGGGKKEKRKNTSLSRCRSQEQEVCRSPLEEMEMHLQAGNPVHSLCHQKLKTRRPVF